MSLAAGVRIGAFEVIAPLGKGGMGEVYRARDSRLHRDVALKVLPDLFASDPDRLARFRNEARLLASLGHPNIAAVYGLEESDATRPGQPVVHALVLELIEGPTLADRIALGPVPLEEALAIARQIAEALEAAHEHKIVHRDLKPANIKLRADGTVKVLDFGLAKALDPESVQADLSDSPTNTSRALTAAGVILGTAAYMAPEQAIGKAADKRSDIWSFGVVLYEMLTARSPFAADTTVEALSQVLRAEPDWAALPATVPGSIVSLLKRCLQKDRTRRLRDIADARFHIEEAAQQPPGSVAAAAPVRKPRTHERLLWAAALIAVAIAAASATRYLGVSAPPDEIRLEIAAPPTTKPTSIALSPDARSVVFAAISDGTERLMVRSLHDGSTRMLAGTDGAQYPFWSPDSRSIAFVAGASLKRIDIESGAVQTLAFGTYAGAWTRDDTILFTTTPSSPLVRIPATGGTPSPVIEVSAQAANHRFPRLLPDGRHFLYYATGSTPGIYVGALDSHDTRRLLEADAATYTEPGYLLFVRQGALFAQPFDRDRFEVIGRPVTLEQQVVSDTGDGMAALSAAGNAMVYRTGRADATRQLVWFDRSGKELQRVPGSGSISGVTVSLSPDGRTAAFEQLKGTTDIWLLDLARGVPNQLTSDPAFELYPVWSPDGTRIAFLSTRPGLNGSDRDLYVKSLSTGNEELLVAEPNGQQPTDWSPDGRFVLYTDFSNTPGLSRGIRAVDLAGDRKPFPVVETSLDAASGQFSPDGKWIAFQSRESGGQSEVFVQRFPGPGGRTQVSSAGGVVPRWRRDGKEMFYIAPDNRLMAVPIRIDTQTGSVDVGTAVALFTTRLAASAQRSNRLYEASADGQRFLMDTPAVVTMPITVVLNWKGQSPAQNR